VKVYKPFHFKQFSLHQNNAAMKVGTDGVLLGAWTSIENPTTILDVGTGTGLIAMMMAQRFPNAKVVGMEIDENACLDAALNFESSKFSHQLELVQNSLFEFQPSTTFDLVVCNPPYFTNGLANPDEQRAVARHLGNQVLESWLDAIHGLMGKKATMALILPIEYEHQVHEWSNKSGLFIARLTRVRGRAELPFKRVLFELVKGEYEAEPAEAPQSKVAILTLETTRNNRTSAYQQLTKDFYL
jgi:tRNA1Val (adenine37-N6)-methyltransferase